MAETKNIEAPPASEPAAPAQPTPVVVRERGSWVQPLVAGLVVVAALVLGGVGGFALATATHSGGRPAIEQVQGGPQQGGPQGQQGGPQGQNQGGPGQVGPNHPGGGMPGGPNGDRPQPPSDQSDSGDDSGDDSDGSTEG